MLNLLLGEFYRLLHKKSFYIYFGALAVGYLMIAFIRSGSGAETMATDSQLLATLLPAFAGGYFFATVYTDDLSSRNLTTLVGYGLGKPLIAGTKILVMALFNVVFYALMPWFMALAYTIFGARPDMDLIGFVYACLLQACLVTVAFAALAAIVVYGVQRSTFGIVAYLLLALGIVSQLVGMVFNWDPIKQLLPGLSDHLMAGISNRILLAILGPDGGLALPLVEYFIYLGVAVVLSMVVFQSKELEFAS